MRGIDFGAFQRAIGNLRSGNTGEMSRKEYKGFLIKKFTERFNENSMSHIYEDMVELDYHKDGCAGQITIHFDENKNLLQHKCLRFTYYGDHVSISGNEINGLSIGLVS